MVNFSQVEIEEKIKDLALDMYNIFQRKQKEKFTLWENHRILKGRISQTSADFESLLAKLLNEVDNRPNIYFLTDYCLSITPKEGKGTKLLYPDIVVVREEGMTVEEVVTSPKRKKVYKLVVEKIFELKIDLAFDDPNQSKMEELKKEKNKAKQIQMYKEAYAEDNLLSRHLERLRPFMASKDYDFSYKHRFIKNNTIKTKKITLEISDDFQWYCILLTSANDHLKKFDILKDYINRSSITNFSMLMDEHANRNERDLKKNEVNFNEEGIKQLAKFLCEN